MCHGGHRADRKATHSGTCSRLCETLKKRKYPVSSPPSRQQPKVLRQRILESKYGTQLHSMRGPYTCIWSERPPAPRADHNLLSPGEWVGYLSTPR